MSNTTALTRESQYNVESTRESNYTTTDYPYKITFTAREKDGIEDWGDWYYFNVTVIASNVTNVFSAIGGGKTYWYVDGNSLYYSDTHSCTEQGEYYGEVLSFGGKIEVTRMCVGDYEEYLQDNYTNSYMAYATCNQTRQSPYIATLTRESISAYSGVSTSSKETIIWQ